MKLLFKAVFRVSHHGSLIVTTFFSLLLLTLANQCEIFSLGMIANTGADFFSLFEDKKNLGIVDLEQVKEKWDRIDRDGDRKISKRDAAIYLSQTDSSRAGNPVSWVLHRIRSNFDIEKNFVALIVTLVGVALFKAVMLFWSRYMAQLLSIRITRDLRQQFFEHIQSLPMSFYQEHHLGSLSSRAVGDANQIASSLNSCLVNYLQTPFTIFSTLVACFYLSWRLSLVIFLGLPLVVLPVIFLTHRVKKISRQLQRNQETFSSTLLDFLSGIQTVKIFAMEAFSLRKYREQNEKIARLEGKNAKYNLLTRPILHLVATSCLCIVVLFGLYYLHMSVAELLMFCALLHLFYEPVKKFAEENTNVQKGVVAVERLFEVLHLKPQICDRLDAIELKGFHSEIIFDRVWFKYDREWVIRDLSFKIQKGEVVAIVGATGSGKSTLVQLLPRLYEIQKGEILIDGKPLSKYTQKSLREQIAFVSQKPFLFYDTVAENIAFGRNFTQEEIQQAAEKAFAHEFIMQLPDGYNAFLAETGKNLSGGQQQRLTIARALVKKAPILILDEATSSLDAISERQIQKSVQQLRGQVTQILIAHRLSTIEYANRIIFLKKGQKVAEGTKQELLKNCSEFRDMWIAYHQIRPLMSTQS